MDFRKKTIRDIDWQGKVALVRVDYNVPLKDGEIVDDMRIRASLPTIEYLVDHGAKKVVLISHLGRPEGQVKPELSLKPVVMQLAVLLAGKRSRVHFMNKTVGPEVKSFIERVDDGSVILLENLRFSPDEEANSEEFAKQIVDATGADVFVQDGFAVIHRAHASTDAVARLLPGVAGLLVEKEVSSLEGAISDPEHPVLVIIGGAKVADKQPLIERFLPIADSIAVGGKIAADGYEASDPKIFVANGFAQNNEGAKLDIDEASANHIIEMINGAKTIVWNGTMGMTEEAEFSAGSRKIAEAMGHLDGATTIVGGGDTAGYVESLMKEDKSLNFSLVSTGGGASLELLSGETLPGLEVLQNR